MKRCTVLALACLLTASTTTATGTTVTFEDLGLPANSFDNGNPIPSTVVSGGQFVSSGASFNNSYDSTFDAWYGWAVSSKTDTSTPDFSNQYSAITGTGAGGSATYAVGYTFGPTSNPTSPAASLIDLPAGTNPVSVEITNTTYAYFTMLNGNQFSAAFGPGSFFQLDIKGFSGLDGAGSLVGDVPFYLANFLGTNHYIVNTWDSVNLSALAGAKSLQFQLTSSDTGGFGINTPTYFALDNLVLTQAAVPEPSTLALGLLAALGGMAACRRSKRLTAG
jgi:hypothetical protein